MTKRYYFPLSYLDDSNQQDINQIKNDLKSFGIDISVFTYPSASVTHHSLVISYDPAVIRKKATRNAGRKKNYLTNPERLTLGEVKELLKSQTAEEVAKRLGMSRATFFRHYKKQTDFYTDDSVFF